MKYSIKFKEMNEADFDAFLKVSKPNYAAEKMRAHGLSQEVADEVAEDAFSRYLPNGFKTPEMFLFLILDSTDEHIGHLWYVIKKSGDEQKAYIADIYLNEMARGKGYGKQALSLLEEHVKAQGLAHIGLHVFGHNETAVALYKSFGYIATDLIMEKTL